jgi:hypothetical protein
MATKTSPKRRSPRNKPGGLDPTVKTLRGATSDLGRQVRSGAVAAKDQAIEKLGQATTTIKEEAATLLGKQKDQVADRVDHAAATVDRIARVLHSADIPRAAGYAESAATGMSGIARYLEDADVPDLLADAGDLAKRHPAIAMGTLFTLGLVAGRFVKAAQSPDAPAPRPGQRRNAPGSSPRRKRD